MSRLTNTIDDRRRQKIEKKTKKKINPTSNYKQTRIRDEEIDKYRRQKAERRNDTQVDKKKIEYK